MLPGASGFERVWIGRVPRGRGRGPRPKPCGLSSRDSFTGAAQGGSVLRNGARGRAGQVWHERGKPRAVVGGEPWVGLAASQDTERSPGTGPKPQGCICNPALHTRPSGPPLTCPSLVPSAVLGTGPGPTTMWGQEACV